MTTNFFKTILLLTTLFTISTSINADELDPRTDSSITIATYDRTHAASLERYDSPGTDAAINKLGIPQDVLEIFAHDYAQEQLSKSASDLDNPKKVAQLQKYRLALFIINGFRNSVIKARPYVEQSHADAEAKLQALAYNEYMSIYHAGEKAAPYSSLNIRQQKIYESALRDVEHTLYQISRFTTLALFTVNTVAPNLSRFEHYMKYGHFLDEPTYEKSEPAHDPSYEELLTPEQLFSLNDSFANDIRNSRSYNLPSFITPANLGINLSETFYSLFFSKLFSFYTNIQVAGTTPDWNKLTPDLQDEFKALTNKLVILSKDGKVPSYILQFYCLYKGGFHDFIFAHKDVFEVRSALAISPTDKNERSFWLFDVIPHLKRASGSNHRIENDLRNLLKLCAQMK